MEDPSSSDNPFEVVRINKGTEWSRAFFRKLGIMSARDKRRLEKEAKDEE